MEESNYEAAEKERQKKEVIAYRNKKKFSALFMTVACIAEIIITFVIMIALLIIVGLFVGRVLNLSENATSIVMTILLVAVFIGGLILGFFVYKKLVCLVIKKFKLEDKLMDDVLIHYTKETKEDLEQKLKR